MYHDMNESDKFNSEQKNYRQKIQAGFHFYKVKKFANQIYGIRSQNSRYFKEGGSSSGSEET